MNLRALTRGDAAVAGAAVLLLISSFLPYRSADCGSYCRGNDSFNSWKSDYFPILQSVFLLGIIGAVLIVVAALQKATLGNKEFVGLRLDQWGKASVVIALWGMLWSFGGLSDTGINYGGGAWLGLVSLLVMAGVVIAGGALPALQAPLSSGTPAVGQQYPQYGGQQQPGAPGYGYPGAQQQPFPGQPQPEQGGAQPFGQAQPAPGGYGFPQAAQAAPSPAAAAAAPLPTAVQPAVQEQVPAQGGAPFAPFWFAVPAVRQLANKDNPAAPAVGELVPGTWYLAVDQRGSALVAQLPDGTHGVLNDTTGIQRG
ncbi:hypothetical protein Kpho02_47000 [Kitasatospora phosalacinea]|uniref:Uncharacterized protein n=1 Tax=Kitasatospora phosalacinea TaxID=2065 RepID=A0A9W6QBN5_9ACTN|nr:hypothetical protein [Kitasatospora phosalacinea]GLW72401.1 hypothetical protein Kpho02_47000 [Kitasatospora phosalacinea]